MRYLVLIYIILSLSAFSYDKENIIDGNMDLKINNIKEDFYPLYIDEVKEEGYIGLKELFLLLELENLKVDLKNLKVEGELPNKEKVFWTFDEKVAFIENEDIYINLKSLNLIFPVDTFHFDLNMLNITIKLGFKTPSDIRYEQELKRKNIFKKEVSKKNESNYSSNKSKFSPGVVQLQYESSDFSKGDTNSLEVDYSTQLLYGEFSSDFTIFNKRSDSTKASLNRASLRYNDVFNGKDLLIGSFYMRAPSIYNIDTTLNGFTILDSNDRYDLTERGKNTFEGYARDGSVVELYRNGTLIDYQNVNNSKYSFTGVDLLSLTDKYYLRIYNEDGTYVEKDLSLFMNNKVLPKNKWGYSIQGGKVDRKGEDNFLGTLKYGLTNNLTLETGYYNLSSTKEEDDDYLETSYGFIYNSSPIKFPFWINGNWYHDLENEDGSLILEFSQNIYDFKFSATYDKYSKRISDEERKDEVYNLNLKRNFKNFTYGVGYGSEVYKGEKYNDYSSGLSYNYKSISNGLDYTFQEYSEDSLRNKHRFKYQLGIGGFDILNISSSAEYKYNYNWELEDEIYTLKFVKRNSSYYSSKKVDFSVNFTYSEKSVDKFLSEFSFTLYLEEFGLPFTSSEVLFSGNNKNSKKFGNKTKKTIILEDVVKDSKMKNISNSWAKGKVYIDYNSNGIYDSADSALESINVSLQGKTVVTDENGDYFVENISSNTLFKVKLDKT
ncbi:MAG: hypothetical protein ACRC0V_05230, partial [Fusobacteriaceae bacterium]